MATKYIACLRLNTGAIEPMGWSAQELSKKQLRRATKQFSRDSDVVGSLSLPWWRLYVTLTEMRNDIPRI